MQPSRRPHSLALLVVVICVAGSATSRHLDATQDEDEHWHRVVETAQRGDTGLDELEEELPFEDDGDGGQKRASVGRGRWTSLITAIVKDTALSVEAMKCAYNSVTQIPGSISGDGFDIPKACCEISVAGFIQPFEGFCN